MPEYLAPGVFVEETSFRAKTIEGVPTSTTGFAGMTRYGPVQYTGGPNATEPRLVTSFIEFERMYGKLEPLAGDRLPFVAHAARAFFLNGGSRLYISRVYTPEDGTGVAAFPVSVGTPTPSTATWRARWPGSMGNVLVTVRAIRSQNIAVPPGPAAVSAGAVVQTSRARAGALVEVTAAGDPLPGPGAALDPARLRVVRVDAAGVQTFYQATSDTPDTLNADDQLVLVELQLEINVDAERTDLVTGLGCDPEHRRFIGKINQRDDPEDEASVVWLDYDFAAIDGANAVHLAAALAGRVDRLTDGTDGQVPSPDDLAGQEADPDDATLRATGLAALGELDDIAIVALPDAGAYDDADLRFAAADHLVQHAYAAKYRIAIVDGPQGASLNEIRAFRGRLDSTYAALYHPWIEILDPNDSFEQGAPPAKLLLPPSGFVAGIYARTDVARGVHKAPANEVVFGLTRFEANINTPRQQVLNPEGINALRFFPGRGNRVWGARTLSSDPEWKYVNVRRFFIFLEHSIDKATQWAVFEPNGEDLWRKITRTVKDFLEVQWRSGALLGTTTEQAYFVRCDRTTMTQNDIDNGRLICLIGVAPTRPAEFVIFRIGQWTADARS